LPAHQPRRAFPSAEPRQRPVLGECGINRPIDQSFAPIRPINRRPVPFVPDSCPDSFQALSAFDQPAACAVPANEPRRAFPSAEPRQRPVLGECGINRPINPPFAPNRPINRRPVPSRIMSRAFPSAEPRQRPVLSECGINHPINRSFAPSRPINRRLAPSQQMSRAFPSAQPRQRPVLGGLGLKRTKTGGLRRAGK
jgi:hypothetical protein